MPPKNHTEEAKKKIGDASRGRKASDETKKKLSLSKMGDKNPQYGKPMTDKCRAALLASRKGKPTSEATKKKMSEATKKTYLSDSGDRLRKLTSERSSGAKSHFWKGGVCKDKDYMREAQKLQRHNRRARVRAAVGSFTVGEWETLKKQYGYKCPICGRQEPDIQLTIDHVIPLAKGGDNNISNIQPLCMICNKQKAVKIFRISKKGELMLF